MPKKPTKWGIKCFNLADSDNGYMHNVIPYTGHETLDDAHSEFETLPQAARVVMELVEPNRDQGWHVFTDKNYTSVPLAQALHNRATSFTGTANKTEQICLIKSEGNIIRMMER